MKIEITEKNYDRAVAYAKKWIISYCERNEFTEDETEEFIDEVTDEFGDADNEAKDIVKCDLDFIDRIIFIATDGSDNYSVDEFGLCYDNGMTEYYYDLDEINDSDSLVNFILNGIIYID